VTTKGPVAAVSGFFDEEQAQERRLKATKRTKNLLLFIISFQDLVVIPS
jgi:hypothetical protein